MARSVPQFIATIRECRSRRRRSELGQVLMIAALLLPVTLGMVALAVDIGSYESDRRQLQNAADAIALAAARDLPDATAATATGQSYAAKNNIPWSNVTFVVTPVGPGNVNPKVSVDIQRPHGFVFIKALGVGSADVGAHAASIKTSPGGAPGLMPWSVTQSVQEAATPGQPLILKYDANNVLDGNFGPLAYDGTGAKTYGATIDDGSASIVCAKGVASCTTVSPECSGYTCPTETGNMVGPTRSGVDERINDTDAACSSFSQVFSGPVDGKYQLNPQCNPWLAGSKASDRVIILPLINSLCNGRCSVDVLGFAMFFLEGYDNGKCQGSSCEIKGRFVNADVTVNGLTGVYDPNSSIHYTRLSE